MLDIIQGEKQPWAITIVTKNAVTGKTTPLDLAGFSEITVCFKTGTIITTLTQTGGDITVDIAVLGEISGNLTVAQTDALPAPIEDGSAEISVDFGSGDVRKSIILNSHRVTAKLCA